MLVLYEACYLFCSKLTWTFFLHSQSQQKRKFFLNMSHKQTEGDLCKTWKHYMKKVEKSIMSLPMLWLSSESHVASLMKAKQTLRKLHAKQFHSPERIQKRKHKPWISVSQNAPLTANKVDATHLFTGKMQYQWPKQITVE